MRHNGDLCLVCVCKPCGTRVEVLAASCVCLVDLRLIVSDAVLQKE